MKITLFNASSPRQLLWCGLVAVTGSVLGFFGAWSWFLDLFAHFRIQYFWGLLLIGALLLLLRRCAWGATLLAFAALNLAVILPFYLGKPKPLNHATTPLRIMHINVNIQNGNHQKVIACVQAYDPDFIVLEEIGETWFNAVNPAIAASHPHHTVELRGDPFGIGLWSKHPFAATNILYCGGFEVPSILAELDTPHGRLAVLATHPVPPIGPAFSQSRNAQFAKLADLIRDTQRLPLVFVGDLNATPWCAAFRDFVRNSGLVNSAQGRGLYPSWPAPLPAFLRVPIDHVLHTPDIEVMARQTGPRVGSDHLPVIVDLKLPPPSTKLFDVVKP